MSEPNTAATTPTTPPTETTAAKPAPTTPGEEWRDMSTEAFNKRLSGERLSGAKDVLKSLGLGSIEEAKSAIDKAKTLEQERMTETEKLRAQIKDLEPLKAKAETYAKTVAKLAGNALEGLKESERAYIKSIAGDDPVAQVEAIERAREFNLIGQSSAVEDKKTETKTEAVADKHALAKGTIPKSNNTPAKPPGVMTHLQVYEDLKAKNPYTAAHYRQRHERAIAAERDSAGNK